MVVQSKRRLVAYLFLLLVALTGSQATPCSGAATLDFSVDGNGDVSLTLNTHRHKDEYELWTFDFESHRDDALAIVDRSLFPGTFGSCATVNKRLDTPTAFAADFDPVASGGGTFIQTFRAGTTPPSPRKDAFEYAGSLAELLECKTSRDAFVFAATTFEDESTIAATVYATCFGSLDPLNASVPIVRSETSFPVRVEASRTAVGTASAGATIASIVALPSIDNSAPDVIDVVGLTRFDVEVTFDVTSMTSSSSQSGQYVLYNPDVTPTFVPTGSGAWSMEFVRNLPDENSGRCQLSNGFCTQTLFYRIACKQSNPLANVRATLEGRFTFNLKEESCDNVDPTAAATSCAETGETASFTVSPIVRLNVIGGLGGAALGVGLTTTALININTGNDVLVKNVVAGERLSWQLQVTPASKRSRYSVQLRDLLLCPFNQVAGGCTSAKTDHVLFDASNRGSVSTKFVADTETYQVKFAMIGLSPNPESYHLTGSFFVNGTTDSTFTSVGLSTFLVFNGCPASSSIFNPLDGSCDECRDGYKLDAFQCISSTTPPPPPTVVAKPVTTDAPEPSTSRGVLVVYQLLASVVCLVGALLL